MTKKVEWQKISDSDFGGEFVSQPPSVNLSPAAQNRSPAACVASTPPNFSPAYSLSASLDANTFIRWLKAVDGAIEFHDVDMKVAEKVIIALGMNNAKLLPAAAGRSSH